MIKLLTQLAAKRLFRLAKRLLLPAPTEPPDWTSKVGIAGLVATPKGLSGKVGSWRVEAVEREDLRTDKLTYRLAVSPVRARLSIRPRPDGSRLTGGLRLHRVEFDSHALLQGDVSEALMLLDDEVRALVLRLVTTLKGSMLGHKLSAEVDTVQELPPALEDLLELARHLERQSSASFTEKLRQMVSGQNFPELRIQALEMIRFQIKTERSHTDWVAPPPVRIPDSPLIHLRLDAAALLLYLDEEARALAIELILDTLQSKWLRPETRQTALKLLIEESDREAAKPVLEAWLSQPIEDPELRVAAIRACGRRRVFAPLIDLEIKSGADGVALFEALSESGDPAVQDRAIRELSHPSQLVRAAAAKTLGRLGDLEAIPALVDTLSQDPNRELRRAVRDATAAIQERAGVSQSGEISIVQVDPLEGSLSRVDGPTGAEVSLTDEPDSSDGP